MLSQQLANHIGMPIETEFLQEAVNIIERSRRIFLVVPPSPSPDAISAAEVLARRLSAIGKETSASQKGSVPGWEFLPIHTLKEIGPAGREILITVDGKEAPVGELKYEKQNESLVIVLSPKEKPIPLSAVRVTENVSKIGCVITVGVSSLDVLGDLFQKNPRLFFETPIIAIDHSLTNDRHGEVNLIDAKAGSLTEISWQLVSHLAPGAMNKDEAMLVLAGILEKTENLTAPNVAPQTFTLAAECISRGAGREMITERMRHADRLPILQLWGRAVVRSRLLETQGVLISILTAEDFITTATTPADIPEILRHMRKHTTNVKRLLLLWQDLETKSVFAALKTQDGKELAEFPRLIDGRTETGFFFPQAPFSSFIEAENALIPLLRA